MSNIRLQKVALMETEIDLFRKAKRAGYKHARWYRRWCSMGLASEGRVRGTPPLYRIDKARVSVSEYLQIAVGRGDF